MERGILISTTQRDRERLRNLGGLGRRRGVSLDMESTNGAELFEHFLEPRFGSSPDFPHPEDPLDQTDRTKMDSHRIRPSIDCIRSLTKVTVSFIGNPAILDYVAERIELILHSKLNVAVKRILRQYSLKIEAEIRFDLRSSG